MKIAVIDGLGGGLGSQIIKRLKSNLYDDLNILALGTNALATAKMLESGADSGASGENTIIYNVKKVDIIIGPLGLIIPNSMRGEITVKIAEAVANSNAEKYILGMKQPHLNLVGLKNKPLNSLLDELVEKIKISWL